LKKRLVSIVLALTLIALNACAITKSINNAEVTAFLDQVEKENAEIQKASFQKIDVMYLTVLYSLKSDKLDPAIREKLFHKTSEFFLSPEIKESIIKDLGKGDPERLFYEGFSIRFQKPKSNIYWVYSHDKDGWRLVDDKGQPTMVEQ
jgi:hypothetical protein